MTAESLCLRVFVRGTVAVYPLPPSGRVTLGRGEDNDVRLDEPSVSRRHAVLHMGPPLRIEDLGSANGTVVRTDGGTARAHDPATLAQRRVPSGGTAEFALGDQLQLGVTLLVVERADSPAASPPARPSARSEGADRAPVLHDPAMVQLYELATRVAASSINVLIYGETGSGKEVLAQAVHTHSPRAAGPMVGFNCAALSPTLLESELFGYEKGAFTGATAGKTGLLEAAHGGTVFLDEVGEMSAGAQAKLLRVLEERAVLRVGGTKPRPIDVRFVAATHRDLEAEAARGAFRHDLFFRLSGVVLTVPPLRARPADILPLAEMFARRVCEREGRTRVPSFGPAARDALLAHPWPGNVRELRNVIERAVLLSAGATLEPAHLFPGAGTASYVPRATAPATGSSTEPPSPSRPPPAAPATIVPPPLAAPAIAPPPAVPAIALPVGAADAPENPLPRFHHEVAALERQRILEALERCGGNQTRAAELLGISRRTMVTRLAEYGVPRPRKR